MGRVGRAVVLIAMAAVVVAVAGVRYLGPAVVRPEPVAAGPSVVSIGAAFPASMDWRSTTTGWAVTTVPGSSRVYGTTDGGRHWRLQLVAPGSLVVRFFDARHGVLMPAPLPHGVPLPPAPAPCPLPAAGQCPQPPRGQFFGAGAGGVYRSDDGGAHWGRSPVAPVLVPGGWASFADPSHGWLLSNAAGRLYGTGDGGRRWTELGPLDPSPLTLDGPLWFADDLDGWMATSALDGSASIRLTHDGGRTWRDGVLPAPPGGWHADGPAWVAQVAMSRGGGVLVLSRAGGMGFRGGDWAYVTSDGGVTWSDPVPLPVGADPAPFVDGRDGWTASDDGFVTVTSDGGRAWDRRPGPAGMNLRSVTGVSASVAVAVATPPSGILGPSSLRLYATTDGGRTWRQMGHLPS